MFYDIFIYKLMEIQSTSRYLFLFMKKLFNSIYVASEAHS